jgi:carbamoyl-phosphate synthase small subunit
MTGYQEVLTDPSYAGQIVTFTYPHIGNVGVNALDMESSKAWAVGMIVREITVKPSNWRSQASLQDFLIEHEMDKYNKYSECKIGFTDIIKIVKRESRYERE